MVITTDGMENASKHYSYREIKKMIKRQKEKYNWEFVFLGANIDAVKVAGNIGIGAGHAVNYHNDCEGTKLNYRVLGAALSKMRSSTVEESAAFFEDGDWKADIDKDFKGRKK